MYMYFLNFFQYRLPYCQLDKVFQYSGTPLIRSAMGQKNNLAVLKGDRINRGYLQERVWPFRRADKKSGHNHEVTVLLRWP